MMGNDVSNSTTYVLTLSRRPFPAASAADSHAAKMPMPESCDAICYEGQYSYQFLVNLLSQVTKAGVKPDELANQILAYASPKLSEQVNKVQFRTVFTHALGIMQPKTLLISLEMPMNPEAHSRAHRGKDQATH
jgi:hypothetical protein